MTKNPEINAGGIISINMERTESPFAELVKFASFSSSLREQFYNLPVIITIRNKVLDELKPVSEQGNNFMRFWAILELQDYEEF